LGVIYQLRTKLADDWGAVVEYGIGKETEALEEKPDPRDT
jgi:hypothetical protein